MSNNLAKFINSRRRHKTDVKVARQVKIAQAHGLSSNNKSIKEPHRMAKHHVMDCGQPGCMLCGNPRKLFKELTTQEKRMFQDLDNTRDRHSNGLPLPKDSE